MPDLVQNRLFSTLDPAELRFLNEGAEHRNFAAGDPIFREGDPGDGFYIVSEGKVEISALVTENDRRVLKRVLPGDFFGEMAVLDGERRSACAIAEEATKTLFIRTERLLQIVERSPRFAVNLLREFSLRMRDFNRHYIQEVLQAERLTAVGRFARAIIHDFKNPLHIIGLAAEIAEMETAPAEMRKNATKRIRKQVDRLNNMVSELLEFTKGSQQAVLATHDFQQVITSLLGEITPELEDKGVKIVVRSQPPSVILPLDPKRLLHIFTNLLHNGVEAIGGKGTIFVSFQQTPTEVVTEIEDTGKGIAPEIAGRLFEPFATFGKAKGSGLGLSICKRIVQDHRGWIRAQNRPEGGAIFSFGLPVGS